MCTVDFYPHTKLTYNNFLNTHAFSSSFVFTSVIKHLSDSFDAVQPISSPLSTYKSILIYAVSCSFKPLPRTPPDRSPIEYE